MRSRTKSRALPRARVGIFASKTSSRTPGKIGELCATRRGKECRVRRCQRTSRTRARRRRSPSRSKRSTCKTRARSVDVRRVDDDVKEPRELVDAKFAALATMLRENLSAVASRAQLSLRVVRPRREGTRKGWRRLIKSDVVAVLQSREDLEATFALPIFDSDSREYLQGCNFAFGECVRRVAAETPRRRATRIAERGV